MGAEATAILFTFIFFFVSTDFVLSLEYQTLVLRSLPQPQTLSWTIQDSETLTLPDETAKLDTETSLSVALHHRDSLSFNATPESLFSLRLQRDAATAKTLTAAVKVAVNRKVSRGRGSSGFSSSVISGLAQGSGEYFTRLGVGTPPKYAYMVLDTGSDVVWIQCSPCRKCYTQTDPVFDPTKSATFTGVTCGSPLCRRLDSAGCNKKRQMCLYQVSYGDGSFTVGDFSTETLTFGRMRVKNVALGCGHDNEGLFVGAAGLLGLGRGKLSFPSQTGRRFGRKFSYCLVDRSSSSKPSWILFGDSAVSRTAVFTPLITNPKLDTFYYLGLTGIRVGGVRVRGISPSLFKLDNAGNGGVIIDSVPVLFDVTKVEKKDVFTGTYMPSTELTGGYRVLSYLDPSEPMHGKLKQLMFFLLKSRRDNVIPEFHTSFTELFETLESELASKGKAKFSEANDQAAFNFVARSLYGTNPADTKLELDGPKLVGKWILFQLGPLLKIGLPKLVEELLIHTFPLPPALVKKDYQRLYDFFYDSSTFILDEAEKIGISRDEACHNLIFATCFNAFGGMKLFFPNMTKWIGRAGVKLHTQLAEEIRSAVRSNGGKVTMAAMEQMPLMKSVVYESLRIEPPVPLQYGRAKCDMVIESHDAAFKVKEGELLFGFQPFATKDPKIFERSEEFVPDRFVGDEGERLLRHVLWSNGPETETPTVGNKQCAGKDFVVLVSRLLVVELFLRYDSFEIEVAASPLGAAVTLTSLKRASF